MPVLCIIISCHLWSPQIQSLQSESSQRGHFFFFFFSVVLSMVWVVDLAIRLRLGRSIAPWRGTCVYSYAQYWIHSIDCIKKLRVDWEDSQSHENYSTVTPWPCRLPPTLTVWLTTHSIQNQVLHSSDSGILLSHSLYLPSFIQSGSGSPFRLALKNRSSSSSCLQFVSRYNSSI